MIRTCLSVAYVHFKPKGIRTKRAEREKTNKNEIKLYEE